MSLCSDNASRPHSIASVSLFTAGPLDSIRIAQLYRAWCSKIYRITATSMYVIVTASKDNGRLNKTSIQCC